MNRPSRNQGTGPAEGAVSSVSTPVDKSEKVVKVAIGDVGAGKCADGLRPGLEGQHASTLHTVLVSSSNGASSAGNLKTLAPGIPLITSRSQTATTASDAS